MKVSDCCGASPLSNGDMDLIDLGLCSDCGDHCEYIEEDEINQDLNYYDNDEDFEIMSEMP